MAVSSLLYVSKSLVAGPGEAGDLHDIVESARLRNERLSVTGALLYTEDHFAQVLEGPERSVSEVMEHIERDPRHTDLQVLWTADLESRAFANWSLAYSGPSRYVDRYIRPFYTSGDTTDSGAAGRLLSLMKELARPVPLARVAFAAGHTRPSV